MKTVILSREFWLAAIVAVMVIATNLRAPGFAAPDKLAGIFNDTAMLMILALGQMSVILTRSIDLSMASNLALTGMIVALINAAFPGIPIPALMLFACLCGLVLGAFNGILIWLLNIPAIVVTLGTLTIYRGIIFLIAGGQWVNADKLSPAFVQYTRIEFLGLPALSWYAIVVAVAFFILMTRTSLGRAIYAVGVNPTASVYAGIDVGRTKFATFLISGLLSGFCGYLWVSRYVIGSVEVAKGYELTIIAACVIGGISIAGGVGTVAGALLGALFLGVINSALPVINVSPFWQMAISGAAIILAVVLNARGEKRGSRLILREAEATS
ncbi:rhamnose transport system permease protein [Pararhizobium capsulatum DSM 1112]|uniref:Rhamnose transport system permease protein n=1 Tax=Pararhizobium capsulatum DSM 1112 TaxID=1121113 RepID=A0ABU0BLK9_9HYPH|nr:ABC transporter permease [Pararhizobium capsulatum]MDQ0319122.1 rhamnose transport system permease protein [Pararhizobium capsulatum DSM 1112]